MTAPAKKKQAEQSVTTLTGGTLAAFRELVYMVPEGEASGANGIIDAIMSAGDFTEANGLDKLPSTKDFTDERIVVQSVHRRQSDNESATGYYLICTGYDKDTGRPVTFSAGGEQAVAMFAKAHVAGWLPVVAVFSKVQTRSQNEAVNVRFLEAHVKGPLDQ